MLLAQNQELRIIGVDIFFPDLIWAQEVVPKGLMLVCADARRLPFANLLFDQVISNQVVEHIVEYDQYLRELARVTRKDGSLIISTENADRIINLVARNVLGWKPFLVWENWEGLPQKEFRWHVHEFTTSKIRNALTRAGFRITRISGIYPRFYGGNFWFRLYCLLKYLVWLMARPFVGKAFDVFHILGIKEQFLENSSGHLPSKKSDAVDYCG